MKSSATGDGRPSTSASRLAGFRLPLVSIAMPFLGLAMAATFLFYIPGSGGLNHWPTLSRQDYRQVTLALWILGLAGVLGLLAACWSMARSKRPRFLAALGIFLNVPPVLLWLLRVGETLLEWSGVH